MDKKKLYGSLLIILLVSILLRFINLNKPEGMWNDEYLTWEIAKAAFPKEFFEAIMRNCHAPLHYIYLKIWMFFFKDSDFSLRLSSLVPGVLSVIMMFFAGRNIGKKTSDTAGLAAALFCAVSSFLIYFSQEVRIYSLLFLLSALHVYFAMKTLEDPGKKNCMLFTISAFLIMLEHTIGFVFVFFSVVSVLLFASKKAKFKKFLVYSLLIGLLIFIPVGIFLYSIMFNQQYFSQWWAPFAWSKLAFFFTDLYSPYLFNITNAPPSFLAMIYDGVKVNIGFVLFALIPLSIMLCCALKSIFNPDKNVKYFLITSIGVYFTVFAASMFDKIIFLTKYMTEIYPALILLAVSGFVSFKNKNFKTILATAYVAICVFFIIASKYSPVKLVRTEGQNIPVTMLRVLDRNESDKVLFLYYPKERFLKYSAGIDKDNNISHISKYDFLLIKGDNKGMREAYKNGNASYKSVFESIKNEALDSFLNKNIFSTIAKGQKFFLVDFVPVSIFNQDEFKFVLSDKAQYDNVPFLYLVFSYVRNYALQKADTLLSFSGVVQHESWRIYIFEKT